MCEGNSQEIRISTKGWGGKVAENVLQAFQNVAAILEVDIFIVGYGGVFKQQFSNSIIKDLLNRFT